MSKFWRKILGVKDIDVNNSINFYRTNQPTQLNSDGITTEEFEMCQWQIDKDKKRRRKADGKK